MSNTTYIIWVTLVLSICAATIPSALSEAEVLSRATLGINISSCRQTKKKQSLQRAKARLSQAESTEAFRTNVLSFFLLNCRLNDLSDAQLFCVLKLFSVCSQCIVVLSF